MHHAHKRQVVICQKLDNGNVNYKWTKVEHAMTTVLPKFEERNIEVHGGTAVEVVATGGPSSQDE
eukprot:3054934-Amphidinium_carterae.1